MISHHCCSVAKIFRQLIPWYHQGYALTIFDVNKAAVTRLAEESGASDASSVAEMSKEVDVVVSMLPSNQHVLDVYTGERGVLR